MRCNFVGIQIPTSALKANENGAAAISPDAGNVTVTSGVLSEEPSVPVLKDFGDDRRKDSHGGEFPAAEGCLGVLSRGRRCSET